MIRAYLLGQGPGRHGVRTPAARTHGHVYSSPGLETSVCELRVLRLLLVDAELEQDGESALGVVNTRQCRLKSLQTISDREK
jgi:hypothetical protein